MRRVGDFNLREKIMRKLIALVPLIGILTAFPLTQLHAQKQRSTKRVATEASAFSRGRSAAEQITTAQLRDYLSFVAADEMEGRDTPSRGLDLTAKFIAMSLSSWGLKPAGDNDSYFQHIALRRERVDPVETRAEIDGQRFNYGEGFLTNAFAAGTARGALVYVGHGWVHKAKQINAYEGVDVRDKIMIVSGGGYPPKEIGFGDRRGKQGDEWDHPYGFAHRHGASGVIIIPQFGTLAKWEQKRRNDTEHGAISIEKFLTQSGPQLPSGVYEGAYGMMATQTTGSDTALPIIIASPTLTDALFQGEKQSAPTIFNRAIADDPVKAFDLNPDRKMSFTVGIKSDTLNTQNVVAVLEGSDPVLKNEYVAIGAHYDHLGVGTPVNGDAIYNGADDNGSGVAAVLAMAKAFAPIGARPKRSTLFIWHSGEERGLLGARYFTTYPPVPINQIVALLNLDMIGRSKKNGDTNPRNRGLSGANEIYVIGSKKRSSELGELSERVNHSYLNLSLNYRYDDPADTSGFFFRSDHFAYAQKGIPVIWYFSGVHEDYHQPSDSVDKIDYQKMEKVVRTVFMTAWEIANAPTRPRVDKPMS